MHNPNPNPICVHMAGLMHSPNPITLCVCMCVCVCVQSLLHNLAQAQDFGMDLYNIAVMPFTLTMNDLPDPKAAYTVQVGQLGVRGVWEGQATLYK